MKLLALYGLKWDPFSPELPTDALLVSQKIDSFCWRVENALVREGGFAFVSGYEKDPVMESTWRILPDSHRKCASRSSDY
jgi:hypothetical protein